MSHNPIQLRASQHNERLAPHAIANLFPAVEGADLDALTEDIRQNGLHEAIILNDGKILDGRARYHACLQAHVEPHFREYAGDDPLGFVVSANLHRRHLNESQRAMIAAKIETFRHGGDRRRSEQGANLQLERDKVAKLLNISPRSVANAAVVRDRGVPELERAVLQGKVAVSSAVPFAQLEHCEQQQRIAKNGAVRFAVQAFQRQQVPHGPYEDLRSAIAALAKLARHSVTTITAGIPDEKRRPMVVAVARFKEFFTGLDAEMRKSATSEVDHTIRDAQGPARPARRGTERTRREIDAAVERAMARSKVNSS